MGYGQGKALKMAKVRLEVLYNDSDIEVRINKNEQCMAIIGILAIEAFQLKAFYLFKNFSQRVAKRERHLARKL